LRPSSSVTEPARQQGINAVIAAIIFYPIFYPIPVIRQLTRDLLEHWRARDFHATADVALPLLLTILTYPILWLLVWLNRQRELCAGLLMVSIGLFIALWGYSHYRAGTLMHMGPGFMPTALGIILVLIGIAVGATAFAPTEGGEHGQSILAENPQWWAWFCILLSPLAFIACGFYAGMAIGTFACVFIAALGDRDVTFKSASLLSLLVTAFGVTLFVRLLQVPLAVFVTFPLEIGAVFYAAALLSYFVFRPLVGSLISGLVVALLLAAVYEGALFYVPVAATFIFAGLLSYFAFRQASSQLLSSFAIEIIPPVFAVANLLGLVFHYMFSVGSRVVLVLAAIGALAFAIGLYFPAGVGKPTAERDKASSNLSTIAFACAAAVLAATCLPDRPYLLFNDSPTTSYIALIVAILLIVGGMLWCGVHYPSVSGQASAAGAAATKGERLFRSAESAIPFALACAITLWACCTMLGRLVLGTDLDASLSLGAIVTAMYAFGVLFAPGARTLATNPEAQWSRRLFPEGERYLPYALALAVAVLAAEVSVSLDLFSNFLQRGVQ
jgi:hypothetical protein